MVRHVDIRPGRVSACPSRKSPAELIALDSPVLAGEVSCPGWTHHLEFLRLRLYGRCGSLRFRCSILQAIAMLTGSRCDPRARWPWYRRSVAPLTHQHRSVRVEWWRHSVAAALVARQTGKGLSVDFRATRAALLVPWRRATCTLRRSSARLSQPGRAVLHARGRTRSSRVVERGDAVLPVGETIQSGVALRGQVLRGSSLGAFRRIHFPQGSHGGGIRGRLHQPALPLKIPGVHR